ALNAGDSLHATVTVTNTGKVAGDEVVELYLQFPDVAGAPRRALRGFLRVRFVTGATQQGEFLLYTRSLHGHRIREYRRGARHIHGFHWRWSTEYGRTDCQ